MATVAVQNTMTGVAVNIAFPTTTGGIAFSSPPSALATLFLQNASETGGATNYRVEDNVGNVIVSAWMDPHLKARLETLIGGTGLANAIANTILTGLKPGAILNITSCANMPDLVATNWEVMDSPEIKGSNKDAKMLSLSLESRAGITIPSPA